MGDEWPHDIEKAEADSEHIDKMTEWMNRYYEAVQEMEDKFLKNQDILDNLAEQHCNAANAEVNRQISDPETGMAAEYGKILEVARRIATGGKVPYKDEKKLMEYSDKLYQAAKSAAMLLKLREKDRKKWTPIWQK